VNKERWQRVNEIFHTALEQDTWEREAYVRNATAGDPELLHEIQTLLSSHQRSPEFLDKPAWAVAPELALGDDGSLVGKRIGNYRILEEIGRGGMGVVYAAEDERLGRTVAFKALPPEYTTDPVRRERLTREARAAAALSHPAIATIFYLEEIDGELYIISELVRGRTLREELRDGPLPPSQLLHVLISIADAVQYAHEHGIVHRDLKPQNIMVEKDGHVVVMDFGIAHSGQSRGVTQTGAFLGTPDYMSPEQARTEDVDGRSDIFSLGLIFYEMLTGKLPFTGKTVLETMFKRTTERAIPPAEVERSVSKDANDIVTKCLEIDREKRYQNVTELLRDLDSFDPARQIGTADRAKVRLKRLSAYRNAAAVAALVLIALTAVAMLYRNRTAGPQTPVAHAPETVLIADFTNHTGDAVFDGTLEPVVKLALEGAGFITAYDRTQLRSLGAQPVAGRLDETTAGQIAAGVGLGVVVYGSLDQKGSEYLVRMKATRVVTGNTIASIEASTSKRDQVMFEAGKLVESVRKALGDETPEASQRFALETFTGASLEVVHEYVTATQAFSNGKYEDALRSYEKAVDMDPNFAMAYRGMAFVSQSLHQSQDVLKYIQLALARIDRMTERERYRTRASYYALLGNNQKCIEEYGALISKYPSDSIARNNLAYCSTQLRDMNTALSEVRQAAAIFPKRPAYRLNISLYASYGSDFETGEREARVLQELDPSYPKGFIALAFAQLGRGRLSEAVETYRSLEKLSKSGASTAASGLADIALYEGRYADAVNTLDKAAAEDLENKVPDEAATKFSVAAYIRLLQGQKAQAIAAAEKALRASKTVKVRFLAGRVLAAAGEAARARALAADLGAELLKEPQSYAKLIEGEIALQAGDSRQAVKLFTESNDILDTWISRFDLGRAYMAQGAFAEADSEFDRCLKRQGEALALFLDESPTYGFFPPIHYYVGRVREGMKSLGFADSYRTYLSIRERAGEDPLLPELRKRTR